MATTFQKQSKHRIGTAKQRYYHVLHRAMVSVGLATRISIPRRDGHGTKKKRTGIPLKVQQGS